MKVKLCLLSLLSILLLMACGEKKENESKENSGSKETVLKIATL